MKYLLMALQGFFVLLMVYVGFAAAYSLLKRKTFGFEQEIVQQIRSNI